MGGCVGYLCVPFVFCSMSLKGAGYKFTPEAVTLSMLILITTQIMVEKIASLKEMSKITS